MAATRKLYLVNVVALGTTQGALQADSNYTFGTGGPPATATMTATGWKPGATTYASSESSDLVYGTVQAAGTFSTTLGPSNGVGTTKCFTSESALWGSFDASTWTIAVAVIMTTIATSGTGNLRVRIYASTGVGGAGTVRELTTSTLVLSNFNLGSGTAQNTSTTWTPGALVMNGEYLNVSIAAEVQAGAVSVTATEINLRQDATNSVLTTAIFTPRSTLCFVGTGGGATAPLGDDNSCNQFLAGTTWSQIFPSEGNSAFLANTAFDPNCGGPSDQIQGPGGTVFCIGNTDGANPAQSWNPATNSWVELTNCPTGSNCYGGGTAACVASVVYCFGGAAPGGVAQSTMYSWATTNSSTGAYVTAGYPALPEAVFSNMALTVGNLIYFGGGDDGTNSFGHWYTFNPATKTISALASMPTGLSGAALVYLDGIIYAICGYTNASTEASTNVVYAYNIATNVWTTKNAFPVSTAFGGAAVFDGMIWFVGGFSNNSVYLYDVAADSWSTNGTTIQSVLGSLLFVAPSPQTQTFYVTDQNHPFSSHGCLQRGGLGPNLGGTASSSGWQFSFGGPSASTYDTLHYGTDAPSSGFGATAQPAGPPTTTGSSYESECAITGSFSAGNWTFAQAFILQTSSTGTATIQGRLRVWISSDPAGQVGVTEITTSTVVLPQVAVTSSTAQVNAVAVQAMPAFSMNGQYLFADLAIECISNSGGSSTEVCTVTDAANSYIETTPFTPNTSVPAFVQAAGNIASASTSTVQFVGENAAGDDIVVVVGTIGSAQSAPTDGAGNTFTQLGATITIPSFTGSGTLNVQVFVALNIKPYATAGGGGNIVTPNAAYDFFYAAEYQPGALTPVLQSLSGTSTAPSTGTKVTTGATAALAAIFSKDSSTFSGLTAGYSQQLHGDDATDGLAGTAASASALNAGPQAAGGTLSGSANWLGVLVLFANYTPPSGLAYADRVMETTTTTGTVPITLGGAVTGYRSFASVYAVNQEVYYGIEDGSGNWETGQGTFYGQVLTRETVFESSNSNALVNFGGVTTTYVYATEPAVAIADLAMAVAFQNANVPQ